MSYTVLARKWRPQNFKEMVGQEHVLRALINALDSDRLHHAYLFTGTRGVGKTTIARILAKCLNCETGVTSEPCGQCHACQEIAGGNFVDLIEVDAASRTKVEDTRELLDNVQYAPTRGRFKVYLIDEVHMLTGHSFNALLKTLEEPPPHVKFLFATTDPQKLPVTILSRCLQFNLKRMPVDMISGHLNTIVQAEKIPSDEPSLRLIARAADGSMRDALSLLDQSIAFGGNTLKEDDVREMLGTISHEPLLDLLKAVAAGDGAAILQQVEAMSGITPDFEAASDELIAVLHQLAVQQVVPDAQQDDENITRLSQELSPEEVQLFYQIALQGRRDLALSPDPRSGFEMLLLRMMSFRPLRDGMTLAPLTADTPSHPEENKKKTLTPADNNSARVSKSSAPDPKIHRNNNQQAAKQAVKVADNPPWEVLPETLQNPASSPQKQTRSKAEKKITTAEADTISPAKQSNRMQQQADGTPGAPTQSDKALPTHLNDDEPWHQVITQLKLGGRAAELIKHCLLVSRENGIISLSLDKDSEGLLAASVQQEIEAALVDYYATALKLQISIKDNAPANQPEVNETPAQRSARLAAQKQQQAEHNIATDPFVIALQKQFGAKIVPGSVTPKNESS